MAIDWAALAAPFPADDVEFRLQQAGETNGRVWAICVPYVTARAIQERLDEIAGPGNWKNQYSPGPSGGVQCGISVRVDGEWITKFDGAENTGKNDTEMAIKGGYSSAFKRAAVLWGIGRYLYKLDEAFANVHDQGKFRGKTKDQKSFKWDPPPLPAWALPAPRLTAEEREHREMLAWLKVQGDRMDRALTVPIGGEPTKLRTWMAKNWDEAKADPAMAATFCALVKEATGEEFKA